MQVPTRIATGQRFIAFVTMQNTGTTVWVPYVQNLGSWNPNDNQTWESDA